MLIGGNLASALAFGVGTADFASIAGAVAILLAIGVAAGALPALRAARIDPITALREE